MYSITLKNNKTFYSSGEETLVAAAKKAGIVLEHSCLLGRCSSCKVKVSSGTSLPILDEMSLTEEEKNNNFILSCVRCPTSNMHIEAEDLSEYQLSTSKTIPAKIYQLQQYNSDIIKVGLRLPPKENFKFLPGQYVNILKGNIKRSYSVANIPSKNNILEFYIKNYHGGVFSKFWFEEAKLNDLVRIEGPKGTFFLRNSMTKNLIFLATGTGIAPVKSILESLAEVNTAERQIYLFWGGRHVNDLFLDPKEIYKSVNFFPVLSREKVPTMESGYVQNVLLEKGLDLDKSIVYACGSDQMIREAKVKLTEAGLPEENFYSDSFVISN